ncbi:MAG TPA: sigma-70 family RNA polymerase sigma factor [Caulobacter sp.]|nr:sigma-70 family RNA polymerase sigma factor [Caulobacter sp.]
MLGVLGHTLRGADPEIVAWVSSHVVPFEADLRQKLRHICGTAHEVDDLVQEIYYRFLKMRSVDHIDDPRNYVFQMARNLVIDHLRRKRVVNIEAAQSLDELAVFDGAPSPERVAMARAELKWVLGVIAKLPERCREVFQMRKVYGLSQAETAQQLGLSENVVEKETMRGMHIISDTVARVSVSSQQDARRRQTGGARAPARNGR